MEQSNLAKLISNYGSKLWSMLSVFIFIPLYIKFLGTENYGLIGFYALLLGIISFVDSGMSSAIIKEFSQDSDANYKYSVFRNLENKYIIVCLIVSIMIFFNANIIVDHWIFSKGISTADLVYYVRLIGIGVTTQLVSSLYFGALFSLNNQVKSNLLQFAWSVSKSAIVFVLFIIFSRSIELYFIWQIICNFIYVLILRYFVICQLKSAAKGKSLTQEFTKLPKHITKYIGGMIFIAIISAINIQADKLVTSSMFDLATFGFYNIASSLAQLPIVFAAPLIAFAFPLYSKFSDTSIVAYRNKNLLIFNKIFYLINIIVVIMSVIVFLYAEEILLLWTKDAIPQSIFPAIVFDVKILILGSFFLALQFPLYYLLLSKGKTKYTIYQGVTQVVLGVPLLYLCSKTYGMYGIPIPWLVINLLAFIYLFIIVNKNYLKFLTPYFYKQVFLTPIIISVLVNVIVYFFYINFAVTFIPFILFASVFSFLISIICYNFFQKNTLLSYKHFYNFPND